MHIYNFPQPPIQTICVGRPSSVPTSSNLRRTSQPSFSRPNTTCLPFSFANFPSSSVSTIKNCDELLFLPELAMASDPLRGSTFSPALSSLNFPPYIDCFKRRFSMLKNTHGTHGDHLSATAITPCDVASLRNKILDDAMYGTIEIMQLFVRGILTRSLFSRTQCNKIVDSLW